MRWFRLPEVSIALRTALPPAYAPAYHAVTLLGTPTLLMVVLAVAVVVAVCVSRVALGVHYLGDVVAGVVLGLLVIAFVPRLTCGRPVRVFAGSLLVAGVAFVQAGATDHVVLHLGGSLGGLLAMPSAAALLGSPPDRGPGTRSGCPNRHGYASLRLGLSRGAADAVTTPGAPPSIALWTRTPYRRP